MAVRERNVQESSTDTLDIGTDGYLFASFSKVWAFGHAICGAITRMRHGLWGKSKAARRAALEQSRTREDYFAHL